MRKISEDPSRCSILTRKVALVIAIEIFRRDCKKRMIFVRIGVERNGSDQIFRSKRRSVCHCLVEDSFTSSSKSKEESSVI